MDWEQFQQGAQASQTYDQWYQQALQQAQNAGGDAGWGPIRPDVYYNDTTFTLPGQQGNWTWDAAGNQYMQPEGGAWLPAALQTVNVLHDNGTGSQDGKGVYSGQVEIDNRDTGMDKFLDTAMPLIVAAMTAYAGGTAIGGAMGAGEGAAGAAAAGEGSGSAAAAEAAPTFSYGSQAPAWSQAGGAELGSGLYGTDAGSMAGMFGTTADAGAGMGSGIGSGLAADGGAWAGTGGGWQAMMAEAGGSTSLADMLKYGKNAYSAYNALTGTTAKPGAAGGSPSGLSLGNALGGGSSAGGFGSSVQMPQQAQATTPLSMLTTPQFANPAAPAAKDATPDELNNSTNILRLAQALRGKTA